MFPLSTPLPNGSRAYEDSAEMAEENWSLFHKLFVNDQGGGGVVLCPLFEKLDDGSRRVLQVRIGDQPVVDWGIAGARAVIVEARR